MGSKEVLSGASNSVYIVEKPEDAVAFIPELGTTDENCIDFEESKIVDELTLRKQCLKKNEALQDLLLEQERNILYLIEVCKKEQSNNEKELKNSPQHVPTARRFSYVFGMPYFKDKTLYPSPPNEDFHERRALHYFDDFDLPVVRLWTDKDKRQIEHSIKTFERVKIMKEIEDTLHVLEGKIEDCNDPEMKRKLESMHVETLTERKNVYSYSLEKLVGDKRDEYDWMKISVVDMKGCHSPEECRAIWFNYLHPSINKNNWSESEDTTLKAVATKFGYQDWDLIAKELGTGRSGYQCMCHYQTRLNDCLTKSKWTSEESKYLCKLVNHFQVGHYIPWAKVTCYLDGRAKHQVYSHWCYVANPDIKKGRFTRDEDAKILAAMKDYGLDFSRIARFLPNRTSIQVRQRFNTLIQRQLCPPPWTTDDDVLILKLIKQHGAQWKKIAEHFPYRSNQQVRFRYDTIQKWLKRNPDCTIPAVNSRRGRKESSNVKLTESVEAVAQRKKNGVSQDVLSVVSSGMLAKLGKKRGRKVGQFRNATDLDKMYEDYFRCSYSQAGGKAKFLCSSEKVPEMANRMCHALNILQADLDLPSPEEIDANEILLPVDKSVLKYIVQMKDADQESVPSEARVPNLSSDSVSPKASTSGMTESTDVPSSSSVVYDHSYGTPRIQHLCPPNFSTCVGLRTFLLCRRRLEKTAALCSEDVDNLVFEHPEAKKAFQLWMDRLASLFTWPGYMSSIDPVPPNEGNSGSHTETTSSWGESSQTSNEMNLIGQKRKGKGGGGKGRGKKKKPV